MANIYGQVSETSRRDDRTASAVMLILTFWLSGSLIVDLVIMPGLATAGMTTQPGFAAAGYLLFGAFNHLELLCGALVMTGLLVINHDHWRSFSRRSIVLSALLLVISLIYTYVLTPEMSGWGLQLDLFEPVKSLSRTMVGMQYTYWVLEICKLIAGTIILLEFENKRNLT
jgi:hypothetical protein